MQYWYLLYTPPPAAKACLPTIIRPINCLWKLILKKILYLPELNCSVVFSLYCLRVSKKIDYFLRNLVRRERRFLLVQYQSTSFLSLEWYSVNNHQVLFFVVLLSPLIWLQRPSQLIVTLVLQVDLQELLRCCSLNQSRIYLIHEKFWPRTENYLCSKTRFWLQFHVFRTSNWSWFPIRVQFLYFPDSILLVLMIRPFSEECIHGQAHVKNCSSVSIVMKYCPISTNMYKSCITLFSCESNLIRCSKHCNRRFWCEVMSILQRNFCLDFTENNWLSHQHIKLPPIYLDEIQILHTYLRLLRKDWTDLQKQLCEKIVSIVAWSAQWCIDRFPCPLLLSLPLDNGVVARKIGHPLSANSTSILSAIWSPNSLWAILFHRIPFLFGAWTNKWPLSNTKLLCKYGDDFGICHTFFFIAFTVTGNVVEHRHKENSSCESFWCFS